MKRARESRRILFAAVIAGIIVSCGPTGMDMMSDAMVDGGDLLMDAGRMLRDGGELADGMIPDAAAQPPTVLMASCEQNYQRVQTYTITATGDTVRTTMTGYAAEVTLAGLSPETIRDVTVVACDLEVWTPPPPSCPADSSSLTWDCTGTPRPAALRCYVGGGAEMDGDRLRFNCGARSQGEYSDPSTADSDVGQRWRTVRFIVET